MCDLYRLTKVTKVALVRQARLSHLPNLTTSLLDLSFFFFSSHFFMFFFYSFQYRKNKSKSSDFVKKFIKIKWPFWKINIYWKRKNAQEWHICRLLLCEQDLVMVVSVCRLLGEVHRQRRQTHHHHHHPQPHHSENTNAMKINLKPYGTNQNAN